MKYLIPFLLSLIVLSPAFGSVIDDCETLESSNQTLIDKEDEVFSLCFFYLSGSKDNITSACNSLAIGRTFPAKESLDNSFTALNLASKSNCDNKNAIKSLRDNVRAFNLSLS